MKIEITTNKSLDPEETIVIINDIKYKDFESLQLRIARNGQGELAIQHTSGYLEAYKAEVNKSE